MTYNLFEEKDWGEVFKILIDKYENKKHPLQYNNLYQLLVMVVLSAQDSDHHINEIAPSLFKKFPNMESLSKAHDFEIIPYINKVHFFEKKLNWLLEISKKINANENIPSTMKDLTALKGIGRKSANVILRESNRNPEGIMVDLHVIRVIPRLGIITSRDALKIEKVLMQILPKNMWHEIGMAISFLGREICRPKPKCGICPINNFCSHTEK